MEKIIKVIDETFSKSALSDFEDYTATKVMHQKWSIFSDYCIGDKSKPNDVASFVLGLAPHSWNRDS
ncbi:hypothetical protein [Mycobacterium sp.]|uniref:hypothetical protein n=1 Tax=Mycobacterium sp. TaxID=1785 RepID=UPI003F94A516